MFEAENWRGVNEVKLRLTFAKHLYPDTIQNGFRARRQFLQYTHTAYIKALCVTKLVRGR